MSQQDMMPMVKMPSSSPQQSTAELVCEGMNRLGLEDNSSAAVVAAVPRPQAAPAAEVDPRQKHAQLFAQKCRELFEPDEDGDIQLHLAIASSHYDVADTLIRLCPRPAEYLSVQNRQSYSPLHIAVLQNQPAIVRSLVVHGASVTSADREGNTPLHLAAIRGYLECGEALLKPVSVNESGSPSHIVQQPPGVVDRCNYYGEQCVHLAAMGGHCRFLQFLCWNNADMNAQEGRGGRTALHFAVGAQSLEAAHCLVEAKPFGCGVDPRVPDWCGKTALAMAKGAARAGSHQLAAYLADKVPSIEDADEETYYDGSELESEEEFGNIVLDSTLA